MKPEREEKPESESESEREGGRERKREQERERARKRERAVQLRQAAYKLAVEEDQQPRQTHLPRRALVTLLLLYDSHA